MKKVVYIIMIILSCGCIKSGFLPLNNINDTEQSELTDWEINKCWKPSLDATSTVEYKIIKNGIDLTYSYNSGSWLGVEFNNKIDLSDCVGLQFVYKGYGANNKIQIKLEDADGRVYGYDFDSFRTSTVNWRRSTIEEKELYVSFRQLKYFWGGNNDTMNWKNIIKITFTFLKVEGGSGHIIIKDFILFRTVKDKAVTRPAEQKQASKQEMIRTIPENDIKAAEGLTKVKCEDNKHTYIIRLPVEYEENAPCPVLFCFDPNGDGLLAVKSLTFAADKYGWIVAGSLDARNGPWAPIKEAQAAMIKDIKNRYKVDMKRFYAVGFSGGARMSYTIAYENQPYFIGVIACGAGFGEGEISKSVAVYHCIGDTDTNLEEVKKVYNLLKEKGVRTELNIFSGGHAWPPEIILIKAVDWLASIE